MMTTDDTIVAISTAAGTAARAIVRLSGPDAIACAQAVFTSRQGHLADLGGFRAVDGIATASEAAITVPCRAYLFRAPRSYTRQDVVELHIPGSPPVVTALNDQLIAHGARCAEAGEFTARAFFSGRLDLSAAEAVADVINADDDSQLRSAMSALGGRVHRLCSEAAGELADVLAGVEAAIDLADEHLEEDRPADLARRLTDLGATLRDTARRAADMPDTAQHATAVIAGRPNVGKSSLLNALTGTDRAIVSATAGTTRDVLSASMTLRGGQAITLLDVAGFMPAGDSLEAAADTAARRAVARADAILFVVDASQASDLDADLSLLTGVLQANARAPWLLIANKIDAVAAPPTVLADLARRIAHLIQGDAPPLMATSCNSATGLDELSDTLADLLDLSAARGGGAMGLHRRQKRCLLAAAQAAANAADLLNDATEVSDVAELAAIELRDALAELGQISGHVVTEDILGRIFARFCVGK